ncbi:Protein weak chloroplast movement under blue light 1 [Apostasia shenzhenica]|uniref:Protein weak chloroplast movement under blue light 1 n=1 Tax=Apostasia shenzhenica TaxID=1088818 RepID=A0A2I0A384_9ASPA|nr:Protein weak chloroplast movement under blue light 1 [Apostasia shenzhenica]
MLEKKKSASPSPPIPMENSVSQPDSGAGITASLGAGSARINPLPISDGRNGGRGAGSRSPESPNSPSRTSRILIDTATPFESVKAAATMFGGRADWKAQRARSMERSKNVQQDLEKVEQEINYCQKQSEAAELAKEGALHELEVTNRLLDELSLRLEKTQKEEIHSQQESELVKLRIKEMEQGIVSETGMAMSSQLKVARRRHAEAVNELSAVKAELDSLQKEQQLEKELKLELIAVKEALELAQKSLLEAEEQRLNAAAARERDRINGEKQLKLSQEELQSLEKQLLEVNDLKLELDTAAALFSSLKTELDPFMETKLNQESEIVKEENQKINLDSAEEFEEVKVNIEKAKEKVSCLRVAAASLNSELEKEKRFLDALKSKGEISAAAISSLEAELGKTQIKLEENSREDMERLAYELQVRTQEADQAKSKAQSASQELNKAKEEAELSKASARTMELRLLAVIKEIEAAKASEKLAIETIDALKETENSQNLVSISLEEYRTLSKNASEAENLAKEKMTAAIDQIKDAKKKEMMSTEKLKAAYKEMNDRKELLREARVRADKAAEWKLKVEQELRDWRKKAGETAAKGQWKNVHCYSKSFNASSELDESSGAVIALRVNSTPSPNLYHSGNEVDASIPEQRTRRKKSVFPRIVMFLAKKKVESFK